MYLIIGVEEQYQDMVKIDDKLQYCVSVSISPVLSVNHIREIDITNLTTEFMIVLTVLEVRTSLLRVLSFFLLKCLV